MYPENTGHEWLNSSGAQYLTLQIQMEWKKKWKT
jgi:hypothetical protein